MKKKIIITSFSLIFLILAILVGISYIRAQNHHRVNQEIVFGFSGSDSISSVTKDFTIPTQSAANKNAILTWTSSNESILEILDDNYVWVKRPSNNNELVTLVLSVKIHNKTINYTYILNVIKK